MYLQQLLANLVNLPEGNYIPFLRQLCRFKNTLSRAWRGLAPTKRSAISASYQLRNEFRNCLKNGGPPLSRAERGQGRTAENRADQPTQPIPETRCVQYGRLREICGM